MSITAEALAAGRPDNVGAGVLVGAVHARTQGDYINSDNLNGLRAGFEYEDKNVYALIQGETLYGQDGGRDWELRFEAGWGWRWVKAGIGLIQRGGDYEMEPALAIGSVKFRATGFGGMLRFHPIETQFVTVTLDGYAANFHQSENTYYPESAGVVTERVHFGDGYGYRAAALFRPLPSKPFGILLDYRVDRLDVDAAVLNPALTASTIITHRAGLAFTWLMN